MIVNGDHDGDSYLVALDRATGKNVWKTMREHKTAQLRHAPYSRDQRAPQCSCRAARPWPVTTRAGKQIWVIDGPTEQFVASMVYNGQLLFMTAGFPDHHIWRFGPTAAANYRHAHRLAHDREHVVRPVADRRRRLLSGRGRQRHRKLLRGRHRATTVERAHRPSLQRFAGHRRWAGLLHLGRRIDDRRKAGRKVRRRQLQRSRRTVLRLDGSRPWPDSAPRREASVLHRRRSDENRRRGADRRLAQPFRVPCLYAAGGLACGVSREARACLFRRRRKKHGTWPQWPNRGRSPLP